MAEKEKKAENVEIAPDADGVARLTAFSPRFERMLIACIFVMALALVAGASILAAVLYFKMTAPKMASSVAASLQQEAPKTPEPAPEKAKIEDTETPVILNFPKKPGESLRYALSLPDGGIGVVVTRVVPQASGKGAPSTEERLLVWYPEKGRILRELRMTPPAAAEK